MRIAVQRELVAERLRYVRSLFHAGKVIAHRGPLRQIDAGECGPVEHGHQIGIGHRELWQQECVVGEVLLQDTHAQWNLGARVRLNGIVGARIQQRNPTPGLLVPETAVVTAAGSSRVYVVNGDHAEARIVSLGQTVGSLVEVTNGLKSGDRVATTNLTQLADGTAVAK